MLPFHPVKHGPAAKLLRASICALLLFGSACQSTPSGPTASAPSRLPELARATDNVSGDQLMQQAATASGLSATALYLSAADAYMAQRDWSGTEAALASAADANQRADLFLRFAYLQAALALHKGDPEGAQQWLQNRDPALAELGGRDPSAIETTVLQAAVCAAREVWDCAANQLIQLEETSAFIAAPWFGPSFVASPAPLAPNTGLTPADLDDSTHIPAPGTSAEATVAAAPNLDLPTTQTRVLPQEKQDALRLNEQIWHYLNLTPASVASANNRLPSRKHQGWWALRQASAQGNSLTEQQQSITQWQRRYSAHAAQYPWPGSLAAILESRSETNSVALLLPLSGPLSAAGNAVRNGFIAAQLADNARLSARFYDSAAQPLPELFELALTQGAQVLIGPLSKPNVDSLQALNPELPVLALNYLASGQRAQANVLQLGLAIEDEADTLARQLMLQGRTRVLIVHSEQEWSMRAAARLQSLLGEGATVEPFANAKTVTEAVGRGMFVEESHLRSQQVFRQIGTHIEFVPRARQDLDAVIALVNNTEAKVLMPALKFHFGDHLPIYATGQATRGAKPKDLAGLSGFQITELPWFVNGNPVANEVTQAFRLSGNNLAALYALGNDAYQIADRLPILVNHRDLSFSGASGALNVQPDGRFTRELSWGMIAQQRLIPVPRVSAR
ncbi:MAG: penicillin-binding protein activator [Pseudomonadales bacterium]